MRFFGHVGAAVAVLSTFVAQGALAQATQWTSPESGVTYASYSRPYGRWGLKFPPDAGQVDATEYIGFFECSTPNGEGQGWCGTAVGGFMPGNILLLFYPHDGEVLHEYFYSTSHAHAEHYVGPRPEITYISSHVNETHYAVEFRCADCFTWTHAGTETGSYRTSLGTMMTSFAIAYNSPGGDLDCPADITVEQHDTQALTGGGFTPEFVDPDYEEAAALATIIPQDFCDDTPPPSSTEEPGPPETGIPVPDEEYDYVVVGAGAGGIPLADKLSEAGHKVLLIEKGPPSTAQWGGELGAPWMEGTGLTRFDVPGFCNEIWHDSSGIACRDTDQMAGCILGGGTAINAALWWKPYAADWDHNFPNGWKASDVRGAEDRVFARIPGTTRPSQDGEIYLPDGMNTLREGLSNAGWADTDLNENPGEKNHTFGYTPYMFAGGERGGPLATYLVSANERSNFDLWMYTSVRRVVREGGHVTGIEVEPYLEGGYQGTVKLTPVTGRVILSAGTFGSARILLRSGIGPEDQLDIVANSALDGDSMISSDQWIDLPVGYNLEDHTNTDMVVRHPSVQFYDFYTAYDGLPEYQDDIQAYLNDRSGILAQSAPNIGPIFFEEIRGRDNIVRQMQYTARMEASLNEDDGDVLTISQYLGRGATSRGRMTLTGGLNTQVTQANVPYLKNEHDIEAVVRGVENIQRALSNIPDLEWLHPAPGVTAREYVDEYTVHWTTRRANHWIGTCKLGTSDGRAGGDSVVDVNTRVYGTDNLYVVDASIFPGHVTTNPSSYIVVAAEHAAQRILQSTPGVAAGPWEQCGGLEWRGTFQCRSGLRCVAQNPYYHQCVE